jgi:hypothetical protein
LLQPAETTEAKEEAKAKTGLLAKWFGGKKDKVVKEVKSKSPKSPKKKEEKKKKEEEKKEEKKEEVRRCFGVCVLVPASHLVYLLGRCCHRGPQGGG